MSRAIIAAAWLGILAVGLAPAADDDEPAKKEKPAEPGKAAKKTDEQWRQTPDEEWRRLLTPAQYAVLRRKATERPFTGRYAVGHFRGTFLCAGCGAELFSASHKYNSGTGWPSFYRPLRADALEQAPDYEMAEPRVEVTCQRCGGHLGHVFNDGPPPTGLRYCINSAAIRLKPPATTPRSADKSKAKAKTKEKPAADPAPAEGSDDGK